MADCLQKGEKAKNVRAQASDRMYSDSNASEMDREIEREGSEREGKIAKPNKCVFTDRTDRIVRIADRIKRGLWRVSSGLKGLERAGRCDKLLDRRRFDLFR